MKVYIDFERGRHGVDGITLGPFDFAQLTYSALRVDDGREIAYHSAESDEWYLWDGPTKTLLAEPWSDVVVYSQEPQPDARIFASVSDWSATDERQERESEAMWIAWDSDEDEDEVSA